MLKKIYLLAALTYMLSINASAQSNIKWVAHRGFRGIMAESTIPAMKNALDKGADMLEFDITFTKDKRAVISHDPFLDEVITLDKDGKELSKEPKLAIYQMSYEEVKKYDVGSKQHTDFPLQKNFKAHIPTLKELVEATESYAKSKSYAAPHYLIEAKTSESRDGIYQPAPEEFVKLLMEEIYKAGLQDRVIIQSFDVRSLQAMRKHFPKIPVALNTLKGTYTQNFKNLSFLPDYYFPGHSLIDKALVEYCSQNNIKLICGNTNEKKVIDRVMQLGVSYICSDFPPAHFSVKK